MFTDNVELTVSSEKVDRVVWLFVVKSSFSTVVQTGATAVEAEIFGSNATTIPIRSPIFKEKCT